MGDNWGGRSGGDLARLRADLQRAEMRLEEITAYYRGQLEAARRRAEDETVRVQASEAGRRRRAEEQVAYLEGELKAVRADAEHAQRRYHELLTRLEELEQEGQVQVDRQQSAAKAAWKTAEEEVERLDVELGDLQRALAKEREKRHRLERGVEQMEERHHLADADRRRLIQRLNRALKLSEQRRQGVEEYLRSIRHLPDAAAPGEPARDRAGGQPRFGPGPTNVEVDPSAGWGSMQLADEMADEFLVMGADESLTARIDEPVEAVAEQESKGRHAAASPAPAEDSEPPEVHPEVSDQEAETLMMRLDVDRKVAHREARSARRHDRTVAPAPLSPPVSRRPSLLARWRWFFIGGGAAGLVVSFGFALLLL